MSSIVSNYQKGHIKRNTLTDEVAMRTIFPEDQGPQFAAMAWVIGTLNSGARSGKTAEVEEEGWVDIYVPEAPAEQVMVEDVEPEAGGVGE